LAYAAAPGELALPPAQAQGESGRASAGAERAAPRRVAPRAALLPAAQLPPLPAESLGDVARLRELARAESGQDPVVLSTLAVSSGVSVGYLLWLTRGGLLLASVVSSLPAWNVLDPIPVLMRFARRGEDEEDGESLGSLLGARGAAPAHAAVGGEVRS
jgi:hypothetical protein